MRASKSQFLFWFSCDCLMKWREIFQLITKRSYVEPKQYYFRHSIENHSNTMFIEYIQVNASCNPFHLRPFTNVARIRFPEETSCGLSLLLVLVLVRRVFLMNSTNVQNCTQGEGGWGGGGARYPMILT